MEEINAEWLKKRIAGNHGVQAELSRKTGLSPDKINKILSGKRRVQAREIPHFLAFFAPKPHIPEQDISALEHIWSQLTVSERQTLLTVGRALRAHRPPED